MATTTKVVLAAKREKIKAALAASSNPAWQAFGAAPVKSASALAKVWARPSDEVIQRLWYMVDTGLDREEASPLKIVKLTKAEWEEKHGEGFAAWARQGSAAGSTGKGRR